MYQSFHFVDGIYECLIAAVALLCRNIDRIAPDILSRKNKHCRSFAHAVNTDCHSDKLSLAGQNHIAGRNPDTAAVITDKEIFITFGKVYETAVFQIDHITFTATVLEENKLLKSAFAQFCPVKTFKRFYSGNIARLDR